jgi:ketosteroid isomerase-like protein
MSPSEIKSVVQAYVDAFNRKDVSGMLQCVHRDITFSSDISGARMCEIHGIDDFADVVQLTTEMFEDRHEQCLSFDVEGDTAHASMLLIGVLAEDLPNGLRAGQRVSCSGRTEFDFLDGTIVGIKEEH